MEKAKLAGEIKDVLNALMQLTLYYDAEEELYQAVETSICDRISEGFIEEGEVNCE